MLTLRFTYKVYSYHNDGFHCSHEGKVCEFEDKAHYCTEALLCLAPALQNNLTFIQLVCLRLELSISYWKWMGRRHTNIPLFFICNCHTYELFICDYCTNDLSIFYLLVFVALLLNTCIHWISYPVTNRICITECHFTLTIFQIIHYPPWVESHTRRWSTSPSLWTKN